MNKLDAFMIGRNLLERFKLGRMTYDEYQSYLQL